MTVLVLCFIIYFIIVIILLLSVAFSIDDNTSAHLKETFDLLFYL